MRIAIIGYGKMGKTIESVALENSFEVPLVIDLHNQDILKNLKDYQEKIDVAIEFSVPGIAPENIEYCLRSNIPVVSGTTGWLDKFDDIIELCKDVEGSFFYSSNYSIGVNLFFEINKLATQIFSKYKDYEVSVEEIHHTQKLDAPSGTAITLANHILANSKHKKAWHLGISENPENLNIIAKRIEDVPGIHSTFVENINDIIEIKHTAKNRLGFAHGAILAAQFIKDRKGVFGMSDLINS